MDLKLDRFPLFFLLLLSSLWLRGQGQAFSLQQHAELSHGRVNAFASSGDGFWIGTNTGLYKLVKDKLTKITALDGQAILSANKDYRNNLWLGTYNGKLFRLSNGKILTEINIPEQFNRFKEEPFLIADMHLDRDEKMWLVTNSGELYILRLRSNTLRQIREYPTVNAVWIDDRDYKWLATPNGLVVLDHEDVQKEVHFKSTHIYQLIEQQEQLYVMAVKSKRSVVHIYDSKRRSWAKLKFSNHLSKSKIRGLTFDRDEELWMAADVFIRRDEQLKWRKPVSIPNSPITCIAADGDEKRIWLGTAGGGLYSYSRPDREKYNPSISFQGKELERGQAYEVQQLTFKQDDTTLHKSSKSVLNELFELLNLHPKSSLLIEGHTSTGENQEKLQLLSEARARAIYNFLLHKGIDSNRVAIMGYGDTRLKDTSNPYSDENKRVEITLRE